MRPLLLLNRNEVIEQTICNYDIHMCAHTDKIFLKERVEERETSRKVTAFSQRVFQLLLIIYGIIP